MVDSSVADRVVRGMVAVLRPEWTVTAIDRDPHGTDFVATLDVETPDGRERVVLKAATADHMPVEAARAEPRMLERVASETSIPVPDVLGCCLDHGTYPAPFFLMRYVEGENYESDPHSLSPSARERIVDTAGRHLAALHGLGALPEVGRIGLTDGEFSAIETSTQEPHADARDWVLAHAEKTLDTFPEGGYFPALAEKPDRFADLVPEIREYLREVVPALPDPEPPTYCHMDYRYGNLLVGQDGEVRAVLDWGLLLAIEPAYNLAVVESLLLTPDHDAESQTKALRTTFREAYGEERDDWSFDAATCERMYVYALVARLDAMACLPLWHRDATPDERDEREREHRAFVDRYL